jgi:hypothetical protein
MRSFKIIEIIGNSPVELNKGDKINLIPQIKTHYNINGIDLRCIEHHIGSVTLKNDLLIVKLREIF